MCGSHSVTFDTLYLVVDTLLRGISLSDVLAAVQTRSMSIIYIGQLRKELHYDKGSSAGDTNFTRVRDLLTLVVRFSGSITTNPRDKIFALLGLSSDASSGKLKPDYGAVLHEVYASTTRWFIKRYADLSILHFLTIPEGYNNTRAPGCSNFPSWVPSFQENGQILANLYGTNINGSYRVFNASGASRTILRSEPQLQLTLRGIYVGTITHSLDRPYVSLDGTSYTDIRLTPMLQLDGLWSQFAAAHCVDGIYVPTKEPSTSAFARLRVCDLWPEKHREYLGDNAQDRRRVALAARTGQSSVASSLAEPHPWYYLMRETASPPQMGLSIVSHIHIRMSFRKIFATQNGYLGVAHESHCVGDQVYILMGHDTPVLLRKLETGGWHICGNAYVHGAMDGEILIEARRKARKKGSNYGGGDVDEDKDEDPSWLDKLGDPPFPFETEEIVLH